MSSWGSGEASALGELQVVRHTVSRAVPDARVPLHDTLVSALQLAEVRATTHALHWQPRCRWPSSECVSQPIEHARLHAMHACMPIKLLSWHVLPNPSV